MFGVKTTPSACCQYELQITIAASADVVWRAIFDDTNAWWLPDFHVAGPDSIVTFDSAIGGRGLVEDNAAGDSLLWYSVHMYQPSQRTVYLIGHIAPEWGGPATSSLKLAVESKGDGSVLTICDARHGNVDEKHVQSSADGWQQLFTDGLKKFVEQRGRQ